MNHFSFRHEGRIKIARTLLLVGAIAFLGAPTAQAQMTLRQAAEKALDSNQGVRGAERTLNARSAAVKAAQGHLLPHIQVDAAYTYMNDDMVLDLDPIRDAMISLEAGNQEALKNLESFVMQGRPLTDAERAAVSGLARDQLQAGLPHFVDVLKEQAFLQGVVTARQPLFTGGKILAGIRAARAQQTGAEAALDGERDAVLAEAAQRYLDVLLATENLHLRERATETLVRHQNRAERLMEEGIIPRHQKMRADVALADAERAEFSAREYLRIARVALSSVLGEEPQGLTVSDTLGFADPPLSLRENLDVLETGNATLRQLRAGSEALEEKARARRADLFPTIYGFGMYNIFDEYMIEGAEPKWAVGIGASFTLFDGVRRNHEWEQARLEATALKERTDETERKLRLLLQSASMKMELAKEQYKQLTAALDQAEENLRLNSRRFDEGLGTSLEVVDAQLSLDAVLLRKASALHSLYSRQVEIYHLMGEMDDFLDYWESIHSRND